MKTFLFENGIDKLKRTVNGKINYYYPVTCNWYHGTTTPPLCGKHRFRPQLQHARNPTFVGFHEVACDEYHDRPNISQNDAFLLGFPGRPRSLVKWLLR